MSDTVLAVVELENHPEDVVKRAAWLAHLYSCELELFLSNPSSSFLAETFIVSNEVREIANNVEAAEMRMLEELAETNRSKGLEVRTGCSRERPVADAIIAKALECNPRFVVKGTHYHSPAERATFAASDWQLIRKLDYPLWFAKPGEWKETPLVVAAVDPTHSDDKPAQLDRNIVETAQSFAARSNGHVVLVHTYQRLVEIGSRALRTFKPIKLSVDELDKKIRDEHRKLLDALASEMNIASEDVHQLPGRTHELLPTFTRSHGANLVVMGARARSGLKRRIVGNTAERTLDHLPCDVLIVHAAD